MTTSGLHREQAGGIARVWLNRPDKHNAFDDHVAAELTACFEELAADQTLRAVVLGGRGPSFCAGGDLAWMRRVADYTHEENLTDAAAFQAAFEAIDRCPHPVIGRLHGAAMGGGAGLVAVCDIVVASTEAQIGFPEVRLGLVPGVISPLRASQDRILQHAASVPDRRALRCARGPAPFVGASGRRAAGA